MRKSPPKAVKLKTESSEVFKALDDIAMLENGWDWENAKAFTPEIIENAKKLLSEVILPNCHSIRLLPIQNSTITILAQSRSEISLLLAFSIREHKFQMNCLDGCEVEFTFFGRFEQSSLNRLSKILESLE